MPALGAVLPNPDPKSTTQTHEPTGSIAPIVWLLMGNRAGDNSQVLGLGEALGWPLIEKHFDFQSYEKVVNLPWGAHLRGIKKERSTPMAAPWPDVVISAGRKNEPIARWIRKRALAEEGKRTRLIHIGRPWAAPTNWDLVITTPQYRLPQDPNILHNDTPLHRVTRARLDEDAKKWAERVANLPRPLITVLCGGNSGPYLFDRPSGERLAVAADTLAQEFGGSLLVTTSKRTLPETTEALFEGIQSPSILYDWKPDDDNPFFAFLGLADRVIVTADSVSMMTEACVTQRPVYLYDTGEGMTSMKENPWLDGEAGPKVGDPKLGLSRWHLKAHIYRLTMRLGPQRLTRDIRIVQQLLIDTKRAVWLGDGHPAPYPEPLRDMERAVAAVKALFATD